MEGCDGGGLKKWQRSTMREGQKAQAPPMPNQKATDDQTKNNFPKRENYSKACKCKKSSRNRERDLENKRKRAKHTIILGNAPNNNPIRTRASARVHARLDDRKLEIGLLGVREAEFFVVVVGVWVWSGRRHAISTDSSSATTTSVLERAR